MNKYAFLERHNHWENKRDFQRMIAVAIMVVSLVVIAKNVVGQFWI